MGDDQDGFAGRCHICGEHAHFVRDKPSFRETFRCGTCRATHRYQGQADLLLKRYARTATSVIELAAEEPFGQLDIYEPGHLGPFRKVFRTLDGYRTSRYWPDVEPGQAHDGVRCEDLMALTFQNDSFDLVITSDVFEHVRHPYAAFAEIQRILRPGGAHVFSIPSQHPMRASTGVRVDVTGPEDIHLLPERRHNGHLVYNDFGLDMVERLKRIGLPTDVVRFESDNAEAAKLVTFCSVKSMRLRDHLRRALDRLKRGAGRAPSTALEPATAI